MNRIVTVFRGLGAFAILLALNVGVPWLLVTTVGNPYPPEGLALSGPLSDNAILGLLAVLAWVFWAQLVVCVAIEAVAEIRYAAGRSADWMTNVPGTLGGQQRLARMLVQAVVTAAIGAGVATSPVLGSAPAAVAAATLPLESPSPVAAVGPIAEAVTAHAAHPTPPAREVTVAKGDTLWSLAERHLGSGEEWRQIADLNLGRDMADGHEFAQAGAIQPGWRLLMPAHSIGVPAREPVGAVVVERGDTLWELAEEEYGDGSSWPRLYDANRDQIGNPDLIFPGQELDVPHQRQGQPAPPKLHTPRGPSHDSRPEPAFPHNEPAPSFSGPAEAPTPSTETVRPEMESSDDAAAQSDSSTLATVLTGGGSLLGAGLLSLLLVRRRQQFRRRRSGRAVATTPEPLVPAEAAVITGGSEGSEEADFLDLALRGLVDVVREREESLPDVVAARIGRNAVELHLRQQPPTSAPSPWREDESGLVWSLGRETALQASDSLAPYPTLVAVGTDESGDTWLVDLESAGIVHVGGEPHLATEVALFMVAELGVNAWSDHVSVTVGSFASPLTSLRPDRIEVSDEDPIPELVKAVRDVVDSCHVTEMDVLAGRVDGTAGEAWMPTVAVIPAGEWVMSEGLDLLRGELDDPAGRKAVGLVVIGGPSIETASVTLTVDPDGWMSIEPFGVRAKANRLSRGGAQQVADLIDHHSNECDEAMPPAAGHRPYQQVSDAAGAVLEEHTVRRNRQGSAESLLPLADEQYLADAATTSEDLAALAPRVPRQIAERILALDPALDADLAAWNDPEVVRPRIRVLGPVELHVVAEPTGELVNRRAYVTELVAYLTARPNGATTQQMACDFECKENAVYNRMRDARKWVGQDPETAESYLPSNTKTAASKKRGVGVYQISGILSDEDLFRRLRLRAQARGPEGMDDLIAALHLVAGRPFDQLRPRGYGWLADTPVDHQLTAAIVDVAHIVSTHGLATGDYEAARWAAEKAILAAPAEEKPRLDLAAVMAAGGDNSRAAQYLADEIHNRSDDGGAPPDLSTRTRAIMGRDANSGTTCRPASESTS